MSETWRGLFPITAFVRDRLRQREKEADGSLTFKERSLLIACDFWHAVSVGGVQEFLQGAPATRLFQTARAFEHMGAVRMASTLRAAAARMPDHPTVESVMRASVDLEQRLNESEDSIEEIISRYAREHLELGLPVQRGTIVPD